MYFENFSYFILFEHYKNVRYLNAILALIPSDLLQLWLKDISNNSDLLNFEHWLLFEFWR